MPRRKVTTRVPVERERVAPGFTRPDPRRVEVNDALIKKMVGDLESGRLPLQHVTLSDSLANGLRVRVSKNGTVTFHVQFFVGDSRPLLKLGDHPDMSLADARKLTNTVRGLAQKGIDPTDGLHKRLIRELLEKGDKWRP
jgi:hypothetical protein